MTVTETRRVSADDFNDIPSEYDAYPEADVGANGRHPHEERPEDYHPDYVPDKILSIVTLEEFAAVTEPSATPLLGTADNNILAAGAIAVVYGDGGAGKTTLFLDVAMHLATQTKWLNLDVPRRCRVLWIENEGPRGMFRQKTNEKNEAWQGPDPEGHFHVLEEPWSLFTFQKPQHRHELAEYVDANDIQLVVAGPVQRLGVQGGGTPAEVGEFIALVEETRGQLERPVAFTFIHHENKSGEVSGAWEGIPDTLLHVFPQGNGKTRLHWQKARWAPDTHGKTWHLLWQAGRTFTLDEKPENTDDEIRMSILEIVRDQPGIKWTDLADQFKGRGDRKRAIRDLLIEEKEIEVRKGSKNAHLIYPFSSSQMDEHGTNWPSGTESDRDESAVRPASRRKEGTLGTNSLLTDSDGPESQPSAPGRTDEQDPESAADPYHIPF